MQRNIAAIIKWVPLQSEENTNLFLECNQLKVSGEELLDDFVDLIRQFNIQKQSKSFQVTPENAMLIKKLECLEKAADCLAQNFSSAFTKLNVHRSPLVETKIRMWKIILWESKLKLSLLLQHLILKISYLYIYFGEKLLILTFRISTTYNRYLHLDSKFRLSSNSSICSNTCPYLLYPLRKISITRLLQILVQNRAELCCHKLIDCLLDTYKFYEAHDQDNGSDNSSVEIYRAITKHLTPPDNETTVSPHLPKILNDAEEDDSFAMLQELVLYEEQNALDLLDVAIKIAPEMLGYDGIKKTKASGESKINSKAKHKVLSYYQQILWGEVGNYLEHIILWWSALPLAARPPHSSQHLREWITQSLATVKIPGFILSALTNLADSLGMHVTLTSWDQHFGLFLISSNVPYSPDVGPLFCNLLQNLVLLSNQCEVTEGWILGAPLDELPLVEQIPVLHRLDHSIHTTRLWALNETKRLANNWNVDNFFMITHCDIVNCLLQLKYMKMSDYSPDIEKGGLNPHVQVCSNMRAKLVSEIMANYQLLQDTSRQCIDTLASVCRTVSLANLQMIFPKGNYYNRNAYIIPETASVYVQKYLEEILNPILAATDDILINNMVLKIMCESWLDHIYGNKIKFSQQGARQLLTDFRSISTWLMGCSIVRQEIKKSMLKNEVLRRCEGVGRLLLRSRGERLKMSEENKQNERPAEEETAELMPPEMYVPNQEQWLELRAHKRATIFVSCCRNAKN